MTTSKTATYFGRKGGGAHFAQGISSLGTNIKFLISDKNEYKNKFIGNVVEIKNVPSGIRSNLAFRFSVKNKLLSDASLMIGQTNLSLMQHPIDNLLVSATKATTKHFSVVHDATPHSGDFWPRESDIRIRIHKSHTVISLCNFSAKLIQDNYGVPSLILPLLGPNLIKHTYSVEKIHDVAFLGRNKSYKGADIFLDAIFQIKRHLGVVTNMLTSKQCRQIESNTNHKITILQNWTKDEEIFQYVAASRLLVLPYRSASQSGWIPIARDLGVPIVATNVGGLSEQFIEERDGFLDLELSEKSFGKMMLLALDHNWTEIASMDLERLQWKNFLFSL